MSTCMSTCMPDTRNGSISPSICTMIKSFHTRWIRKVWIGISANTEIWLYMYWQLSSYQDEVQNELTIFSCMTKHAVGCCSDGARSGNRVSLTLTIVWWWLDQGTMLWRTRNDNVYFGHHSAVVHVRQLAGGWVLAELAEVTAALKNQICKATE